MAADNPARALVDDNRFDDAERRHRSTERHGEIKLRLDPYTFWLH